VDATVNIHNPLTVTYYSVLGNLAMIAKHSSNYTVNSNWLSE